MYRVTKGEFEWFMPDAKTELEGEADYDLRLILLIYLVVDVK